MGTFTNHMKEETSKVPHISQDHQGQALTEDQTPCFGAAIFKCRKWPSHLLGTPGWHQTQNPPSHSLPSARLQVCASMPSLTVPFLSPCHVIKREREDHTWQVFYHCSSLKFHVCLHYVKSQLGEATCQVCGRNCM